MRRRSGVVMLVAVLAGGVCLPSCAEEAPKPKTPADRDRPPPGLAMPGGVGSNSPQLAMPDRPAPTGGSNRPAINAQAMAAHQQGLNAFATGQLTQAEAFFLQATQADAQAYQSYYSLGVVQERLGRDAAGQSYRRAFSIVPDYEEAIAAYGIWLARQENLSEADAFLTDKRGRMPKSPVVATALAEVKSLAKDTASAQRIAQEALKIEPDYRPAMVTIARDHYRNRRLDLALTALKAILDGFDKTNPARDVNNAEARLLRGLIYVEQGKRVEATEEFQRVVQLRPDLVTARLRLATSLLEVGRAAEALPLLLGTLQYDGDNLAAHLSLGDAYRLLGDYAKAKQEFDWVVRRNASLPEVHYNLALMYLFAPSLPGMKPLAQIDAAIAALGKFDELKPKGSKDDSDELMQRAKLKKSELEALEKAAQPQPAVVPASAPAGDAGTDAAAPGGESPAEG